MRRYILGDGTVSARVSREFAALLEALQFQGADQEGLSRLDERQWSTLLSLADLAHLTLPLALRRTMFIPAWVNDRLARNLADNSQRFRAVYSAYSEVALALDDAGIPHVVLKGFAQAPEFVPAPDLRVQSDLDLYCPPEQTESACQVLKSLGYRPALENDYRAADHSPTMVRPGSWVWRGNMYDPEMPPSVEIHFCLWNERVSLLEIPETRDFFERRLRKEEGSFSWWEFQLEDKLAYLTLHILRGVFSADWIVHHVYELATFLDASTVDTEFWDHWENLHSPSLRRIEAIAFYLARCWFSCRMPLRAAAAFQTLERSQKAWLEQAGGSPLECMFRRNQDGRLLQLTMMSRSSNRHAIIRRIFIPKVALPGSLPTNFRYHRPIHAGTRGRFNSYLCYLAARSTAYLASTAALAWRGLSIWMADRGELSQFSILLGACFFLTWACQSTTSCSIFS